MDIILSISQRKAPGDGVMARVQAKKELWDFLSENLDSILSTYIDSNELAVELMGATIWMLHPHYEGPELIREVQFVLRSLKIELPKNYVAVFTKTFARIVNRKIEASLKHKSRE